MRLVGFAIALLGFPSVLDSAPHAFASGIRGSERWPQAELRLDSEKFGARLELSRVAAEECSVLKNGSREVRGALSAMLVVQFIS